MMSKKMLPNLLTGKELAEILRVTPGCIRKYVQGGRIPSVKINGARRFDPQEIQRYIEARREGLEI